MFWSSASFLKGPVLYYCLMTYFFGFIIFFIFFGGGDTAKLKSKFWSQQLQQIYKERNVISYINKIKSTEKLQKVWNIQIYCISEEKKVDKLSFTILTQLFNIIVLYFFLPATNKQPYKQFSIHCSGIGITGIIQISPTNFYIKK